MGKQNNREIQGLDSQKIIKLSKAETDLVKKSVLNTLELFTSVVKRSHDKSSVNEWNYQISLLKNILSKIETQND